MPYVMVHKTFHGSVQRKKVNYNKKKYISKHDCTESSVNSTRTFKLIPVNCETLMNSNFSYVTDLYRSTVFCSGLFISKVYTCTI